MASITYSAPVDEIRGSIGGTTFSRNKAGAYVTRRYKPVLPIANARQTAIAQFTRFGAGWLTLLTDAQRLAWNTKAATLTWTNRLGGNYTPTGNQLYMRTSVLLRTINRYPAVAPPATPVEPSYAFTMDYLGGTGVRVTSVGALSYSPAGRLITYYSGPMPTSRAAHHGPWPWLKVDNLVPVPPPYTWIPDVDVIADRAYFFFFRVVRFGGAATDKFYSSKIQT